MHEHSPGRIDETIVDSAAEAQAAEERLRQEQIRSKVTKQLEAIREADFAAAEAGDDSFANQTAIVDFERGLREKYGGYHGSRQYLLCWDLASHTVGPDDKIPYFDFPEPDSIETFIAKLNEANIADGRIAPPASEPEGNHD